MSIYYSEQLTLADSTSLFLDAALTQVAGMGYYSSDGIVREQNSSGALVAGSTNCPTTCAPPSYVVLTLNDFYVDASHSNFKFVLTNSTLPFNVIISDVVVNIWQSEYLCTTTAFAEYVPACTPCTLLSNTDTIISYGTSSPPCAAYVGRFYRVIDSIKLTIGGTVYTLHNEEKLTINGFDIFIQLQPYCFPVKTTC
jgi:hypothetical protein